MPEMSAYDLQFTEINLQGEDALFTESRVRMNTVPLPFKKYEVRCADEVEQEPAAIMASVEDNLLGTIITQSPLEFDSYDEIYLDEGEVDFYSGQSMDITQFAQKHGIETKPRSGKSTRDIDGVEFSDEFTGDEKYGYHLSFDGRQLMKDGEDEIYPQTLETTKYAFFQRDDDYVMFYKTDGAISGLSANNHFAEVGLLDSLEEVWTRTGCDTVIFLDDNTRKYLPEIADDFGWSIPSKDATRIVFYDTEVHGMRTLFTEETVFRGTVPKSLYVYEIGDELDSPEGMNKIAKNVSINFKGTLITERPLDLGKDDSIFISPREVSLHSDTPIKLKDFAQEVGIRIKAPKEQER